MADNEWRERDAVQWLREAVQAEAARIFNPPGGGPLIGEANQREIRGRLDTDEFRDAVSALLAPVAEQVKAHRAEEYFRAAVDAKDIADRIEAGEEPGPSGLPKPRPVV